MGFAVRQRQVASPEAVFLFMYIWLPYRRPEGGSELDFEGPRPLPLLSTSKAQAVSLGDVLPVLKKIVGKESVRPAGGETATAKRPSWHLWIIGPCWTNGEILAIGSALHRLAGRASTGPQK